MSSSSKVTARFEWLVWCTLSLGLFSFAFFRTAWVCDDAYISFRVVDNFIHGHGLVWNVSERVQVYTHPLWVFIQVPFVAIFHDPYYVALALSLVFSLLTLGLLIIRIQKSETPLVWLLFLPVFSKSFIDFSTSGLENPLLHFILALFAFRVLARDEGLDLRLLGLLMSVAFLVRPDSVVFLAPTYFYFFWRSLQKNGLSKTLVWSSVSLIPFIAWEIFSLWYYGSWFANTYYAKAGSGGALWDRLTHAWMYCYWSVRHDPVTVFIVALASVSGLISKNYSVRLMASGLLLWFVYIFWVGADYMGGRFFSAPFVLALFILTKDMMRPLNNFGCHWLSFLLALRY